METAFSERPQVRIICNRSCAVETTTDSFPIPHCLRLPPTVALWLLLTLFAVSEAP